MAKAARTPGRARAGSTEDAAKLARRTARADGRRAGKITGTSGQPVTDTRPGTTYPTGH
jgi:hypothetical protein